MIVKEILEEGRRKRKYRKSRTSAFADLPTVDGFIQTVKSECSDAVAAFTESDVMLLRGTWSSKLPFVTMDSSRAKGKRLSANTYNYGTLLLSNLPAWAQYPKRDESFICSLSKDRPVDSHAWGYGNLYLLFPVNGTELGVCPGEDLFTSFRPLAIDKINLKLQEAALNLLGKAPDERSFAGLIKSIEDLHKTYLEMRKAAFGGDLGRAGRGNFLELTKGISEIKYAAFPSSGEKETLLEALIAYLDPIRHGFECIESSSFRNAPAENQEAWFSGKAYGIQISGNITHPILLNFMHDRGIQIDPAKITTKELIKKAFEVVE